MLQKALAAPYTGKPTLLWFVNNNNLKDTQSIPYETPKQ